MARAATRATAAPPAIAATCLSSTASGRSPRARDRPRAPSPARARATRRSPRTRGREGACDPRETPHAGEPPSSLAAVHDGDEPRARTPPSRHPGRMRASPSSSNAGGARACRELAGSDGDAVAPSAWDVAPLAAAVAVIARSSLAQALACGTDPYEPGTQLGAFLRSPGRSRRTAAAPGTLPTLGSSP